jgi:hypothetical protein
MRRSIARALALLLALSLLAACSSDGDGGSEDGGEDGGSADTVTAPADYAEGLCTAIADFQADLETQSTEFRDLLRPDALGSVTPSPELAKDVLSSFVGELSDRTQELIDDVEALGTPDLENGEDVRSALTGAFEQVVAAFEEAEADIDGLSTDDPAALAQGFSEVASKLQEAGTEISTSFDDLQSPELDDAAADVEACSGVI